MALAGAQAPHPTPGPDCNTQVLPTRGGPPDWTAGHSDRHGEGANTNTEENRDGTHVWGWLGTLRFSGRSIHAVLSNLRRFADWVRRGRPCLPALPAPVPEPGFPAGPQQPPNAPPHAPSNLSPARGPLQAAPSSASPPTKSPVYARCPLRLPQPFQCHGLCPTRAGTRGRHIARAKGPAQPTSRGRSAAPTRLSLTRKQWSAPECEASPLPSDTHSPGELLRPRALNTV